MTKNNRFSFTALLPALVLLVSACLAPAAGCAEVQVTVVQPVTVQ